MSTTIVHILTILEKGKCFMQTEAGLGTCIKEPVRKP